MTDPFTDVADELMTRASDLGGDAPATNIVTGGSRTKKHVCPYCGAVTAVVERPTGPCPKCNMEDTPATRAATKARIGPWYVLQARNPSAPGMKWATLLSLVSKGQVTPRSVVRGPTTHQLWKFAAHVKGLSREFNLCYSCGGEVERTTNQCRHCDRLQEPPVNPDALLESRDMTARGPIQREIKGAPAASTDMVITPDAADDAARRRNPEEGILSAKELAAAFQLDFNPESPTTTLPAPSAARQRRPLRAFATLILLAAIAGAAVLYLKPDYRASAMVWGNNTVATVKTWMSPPAKISAVVNPPEQPTAKLADTTEPPPPAVADVPTPPTTPPTEPPTAPAIAPDATVKPAPVVEAPVTPPPSPAPTQVPPVVVATPPAPVAVKSSSPPDKAQQDQDAIKAHLEAPIPTDVDAQIELDKTLWGDAIKARTLNDFPLAIRCYERIKQLDSRARQSDKLIQMYLDECQKQITPAG